MGVQNSCGASRRYGLNAEHSRRLVRVQRDLLYIGSVRGNVEKELREVFIHF